MIIGLLSDAHGNAAALRRGLALLRERGAQHIFFCGDAVGYIPGAQALDPLRADDITCIAGNHEAMMLAGGISADRDAVYQLGRTAEALDDEDRALIAGWPRECHAPAGLDGLHLVHGSPADPTFGYVYPDTDLGGFPAATADIWVMGNTHRPFARQNGPALYINTGSCGLPRDDGHLACVCLLDTQARTTHFLRYDIGIDLAEAFASHAPIHPSVVALTGRRCSPGDLVGEIVEARA